MAGLAPRDPAAVIDCNDGGFEMAHPSTASERYENWNEAVALVVYTTAAAGRPAYLDLEDDVLIAIRDLAEPEAVDPPEALVRAVRDTLRLDSGASTIFASHLQRLERWRQGEMLDTPPTLALLAVLSLAAQNMREGDGQAANNFYGRLAQLLDLDERQVNWFISAYRKQLHGGAVSEMLWGSLNTWLERLEGNRGIATAYAFAHAHIGLPLSQALVRRTDRDKFADLFALNGLAPQSSLPRAEMEELVAEWLSRVPCPASNTLERLWKRDREARERITDVAREILEAWNGLSANIAGGITSGTRQVDSIRVKALLRRFPVRRLEIDLIVAAPSSSSPETVDVIGPADEPVGSLDLIPAASGWLALADPTEIDAGSFLVGETRLRRPGQQLTLRRRPRRLIPLRRDDLLQAFVESERLSLGEDALLLARNEIAERVAAALPVAARPGFVRHDSISGLPEGWTLFDGVQILSSIPIEVLRNQLVDLNVLQPLATSQVVLQGGMRLPGNIRKWSSSLAPELRVTSDEGSILSARIICVRPLTSPTPAELFASSDQPVLIWDLSEERLPDGDYEITVAEDGTSMGRAEILRLRSADNPAVDIRDDPRPLAHDPKAPSFGLLVERSLDPEAFRGIPDAGPPLDDSLAAPTIPPKWYLARQSKPAHTSTAYTLHLPGPEQGSCMLTGQHYMLIETATGQKSTVEGICKTCGLVKRYPTRAKQRRLPGPGGPSKAAPRVRVSELETVKSPPSVDWSLGFDALCHLGSGPVSSLERIAMQMEPANLFGDLFARRLEVLGHVELERDPRSLAPRRWEVVEPMLAGLPDGQVLLLGFRSDRMLVAAEDAAWSMKAEFSVNRNVDAPPQIRVESSEPKVVDGLMRSIEAATNKVVRFIPQAANALATRLPRLSQALSYLPTTSMISARSIERWDPLAARFEASGDSGSPGAYRLKGFTRSYIYRRRDDIGAMSAVVGDARIVKFAAALDTGLPLVGYDVEAEVLYVPLGADLPGLYGRAAVLASGRPPRENTDERLLEYRGVPAKLAALLSDLLMS